MMRKAWPLFRSNEKLGLLLSTASAEHPPKGVTRGGPNIDGSSYRGIGNRSPRRDPFCDPLGLLTTAFHRFCCARRVLYVIETTL
jgi:hypothetical protein